MTPVDDLNGDGCESDLPDDHSGYVGWCRRSFPPDEAFSIFIAVTAKAAIMAMPGDITAQGAAGPRATEDGTVMLEARTVVRLAEATDRIAVEAVVVAAYEHYIPRIGAKPGPMLDDYTRLIRERHVHVLVEEAPRNNFQIIGIVVLIPEAGTMLLDNIAVIPQVQGRGYGRKLLQFAEEAALEAGCKAIRLYTHVMMIENIGLYTKIGFKETHRTVEKGLHRVHMAKALP